MIVNESICAGKVHYWRELRGLNCKTHTFQTSAHSQYAIWPVFLQNDDFSEYAEIGTKIPQTGKNNFELVLIADERSETRGYCDLLVENSRPKIVGEIFSNFSSDDRQFRACVDER